jgi:hypothetical protein
MGFGIGIQCLDEVALRCLSGNDCGIGITALEKRLAGLDEEPTLLLGLGMTADALPLQNDERVGRILRRGEGRGEKAEE